MGSFQHLSLDDGATSSSARAAIDTSVSKSASSSAAVPGLDIAAALQEETLPASAWQEPVTPRECSVEGCTFFAGAAGLCSCCYREEFGCAPPAPPPRKYKHVPQEDEAFPRAEASEEEDVAA